MLSNRYIFIRAKCGELKMELMNYDEVLAYLLKNKRSPSLLLGNGFSMAYDSDIFSYNALQAFVDKTDDPILKKIFDIVKTKNFETVMRQLDNFCELAALFSEDKNLPKEIKKAHVKLKTSLLSAIKEMHPEHVFKISDEECGTCAKFMKPYMENGGKIFSTNYDILLYWVLMRSGLDNSDGFGKDRLDDPNDKDSTPIYSDELYWGRNSQSIFYLHGALPLFDTGTEIVKEQYNGDFLLHNIEGRMEDGEYPVFVAAGDGEDKLTHIMHNRYLSACYEALVGVEGSLVTFGFNFGDYDEHIIEAINRAAKRKKDKEFREKLLSVYIGVFSEEALDHIESVRHKFKVKINLYDARTAKVWR